MWKFAEKAETNVLVPVFIFWALRASEVSAEPNVTTKKFARGAQGEFLSPLPSLNNVSSEEFLEEGTMTETVAKSIPNEIPQLRREAERKVDEKKWRMEPEELRDKDEAGPTETKDTKEKVKHNEDPKEAESRPRVHNEKGQRHPERPRNGRRRSLSVPIKISKRRGNESTTSNNEDKHLELKREEEEKRKSFEAPTRKELGHSLKAGKRQKAASSFHRLPEIIPSEPNGHHRLLEYEKSGKFSDQNKASTKKSRKLTFPSKSVTNLQEMTEEQRGNELKSRERLNDKKGWKVRQQSGDELVKTVWSKSLKKKRNTNADLKVQTERQLKKNFRMTEENSTREIKAEDGKEHADEEYANEVTEHRRITKKKDYREHKTQQQKYSLKSYKTETLNFQQAQVRETTTERREQKSDVENSHSRKTEVHVQTKGGTDERSRGKVEQKEADKLAQERKKTNSSIKVTEGQAPESERILHRNQFTETKVRMVRSEVNSGPETTKTNHTRSKEELNINDTRENRSAAEVTAFKQQGASSGSSSREMINKSTSQSKNTMKLNNMGKHRVRRNTTAKNVAKHRIRRKTISSENLQTHGTCQGRCVQGRDPGPTNRTRQCFCDKYCKKFKDCCTDHKDYCLTLNITLPAFPDWKCVFKGGDGIGIDKTRTRRRVIGTPGIWMISSCAKGWPQDDVRSNCLGSQKLESFIPVTASNGRTFRNSFCAKCNGVKQNEIKAYEVGCKKRGMRWKPFKGAHRRYCKNVRYSRIRCHLISSSWIPKRSKVIFLPPEDKDEEKNDCPYGKVFDPNMSKCRPGIISAPTLAEFNKVTAIMWIKPHKTCLIQIAFKEQEFLDSLVATFSIQPSQVSNIHIQRKSDHYIVTCDVVLTEDSEMTKGDHSGIKRLLNFTSQTSIKIGIVDYYIYKVTSRLLACVNFQQFSASEYTVLPMQEPAVYVNKSRETFYSYKYYANRTKKEKNKIIPVGNILVCRLYLTGNCSGTYIPLQKHEYVVFPNGSLYRNVSRELFEVASYNVKNKTAWICTNFSTSHVKTHIGLSLSIFCLILFLFTYSLFSELRTLPGINVMNLSFSLLLQHSIWFLTEQTHMHITCTVIATCIHYLVLVSFTWMSIIAFDTWRAFSSSREQRMRLRDGSRRTKILRFMAVGWIPALIFVIICVILDQTEIFIVDYGGEEGCLIINNNARMFLLTVPTAVSVTFNAIFFVKTILVIRRTKNKARAMASHPQNRNNFQVYARLFVLMGFTWIFGFLALLVSKYPFYPFTIFNTLQGVYIAAAFVFKTQVKELYVKLLCSKAQKKSESTVNEIKVVRKSKQREDKV